LVSLAKMVDSISCALLDRQWNHASSLVFMP
jgi:hypothetical protein